MSLHISLSLTQSLMHKNTKVTPRCREEIYELWQNGKKISALVQMYQVNRKTIRKIIKRGRRGDFSVHDSTNKRYKQAFYGLRRLSKEEKKIKGRLAKKTRRYEKDYPGEMAHFDSKKLPRIKSEDKTLKREYLFVDIDDHSRHLFADILPDKSMDSSGLFLELALEVVPYDLECAYSDNGTEFKGTENHDFVWVCSQNGIEQKFTRVRRPQTNGKAERVIRTIMEECLSIKIFLSRAERRRTLQRYVKYYNEQRPHSALKGLTPLQVIQNYVNSKSGYNA